MENLHQKNKPIDPVTLMELLKEYETITFYYLASFAENVATTRQFDYYSKLIKEQAAKRKTNKKYQRI